MPAANEKFALRQAVKDRIDELDDEYIKLSDMGIFERLKSLEALKGAHAVLCYYGIGREVSTASAVKAALELGKTVALPKTYPHGIMTFKSVSGLDGLVSGKFGIPEPPDAFAEIEPEDGDIILVPGLCFDKSLHRLGHGGGYYDRYLSKHKGVSVGLCREKLLLDCVTTDAFDLPVDILITENRILRK